jgi:secreted trypsin-like serine protease
LLNLPSGPLTQFENGKITQVGIVSAGMGCADPEFPGVYIKVARLLNFVYTFADIAEWQCHQ